MADPATASAGPDPLRLDEEERDLLGSEVAAILPALSGPKRERYEALDAAVRDGSVPGELVPLVEGVLELALQTGRARKLYTAEGERVLTAVFRRTGRGRELSAHLEQVNEALRTVAGHELESLQVRMRTLGHFTLTVESSAGALTLAFRPDGVEVESVSVGDRGTPAG